MHIGKYLEPMTFEKGKVLHRATPAGIHGLRIPYPWDRPTELFLISTNPNDHKSKHEFAKYLNKHVERSPYYNNSYGKKAKKRPYSCFILCFGISKLRYIQ